MKQCRSRCEVVAVKRGCHSTSDRELRLDDRRLDLIRLAGQSHGHALRGMRAAATWCFGRPVFRPHQRHLHAKYIKLRRTGGSKHDNQLSTLRDALRSRTQCQPTTVHTSTPATSPCDAFTMYSSTPATPIVNPTQRTS
jgi:hypothetical protein